MIAKRAKKNGGKYFPVYSNDIKIMDISFGISSLD